MLGVLNEQIKLADKRLEEIVKADEVVRRLCSVPGVGPVVATTFAATLNDASRFLGAKHYGRASRRRHSRHYGYCKPDFSGFRSRAGERGKRLGP
jgi:transposase